MRGQEAEGKKLAEEAKKEKRTNLANKQKTGTRTLP